MILALSLSAWALDPSAMLESAQAKMDAGDLFGAETLATDIEFGGYSITEEQLIALLTASGCKVYVDPGPYDGGAYDALAAINGGGGIDTGGPIQYDYPLLQSLIAP